MKKLLIILLIVLSLVFPLNVLSANYYFDLSGGDDTTGDGSSGNPWKTIDKCTTSRTGGDECRGAKTTVTAISGTCTFTNGSNEIATSVDQSGTVSAGDFVSKNSGLEGWWLVASVDSDSINLTYEYWGLSGSGTPTTGYFVTPVTGTEEYDFQASGTSAASRLKVSGGWDLTGPTQDGITAFSSTFNGIDSNSKNYVELSNFIIYSTSQNLNISLSHDIYYHDLFLLAGTGTLAAMYYLTSPYSDTFEDISITGGVGNGLNVGGSRHTFTNVYTFSVGTGAGDSGFNIGGIFNFFNNIRSYNSYNFAISFGGESYFDLFISPVFDTTRYGIARLINFSGGTGHHKFYTPYLDASGAQYIFNVAGTIVNNVFVDATINADGSSGRYAISGSYQSAVDPTLVVNESGDDSVMAWADGFIEWDSSAECRSGKCLKFSPTNTTYPLIYKVGSVKITSTSGDLTLSLYMKDDASYNGNTVLAVVRNGKYLQTSDITLTTSYVKQDVVVSSSDLVLNNYLDLWAYCTGSTGNMYVDDFSMSQ